MPINKNAVIRYRYIDELLSNKYKRFSTTEIAKIVNGRLLQDGYSPVSLRCIQKDIKALEDEVFFIELQREKIAGKECVRYSDPGFSIFNKEFSDDERVLLSEVLSTIGQFDGLNNFEWLDGLKYRLNIKEKRRIINFSYNPYLTNSNLLGGLFTMISNKIVIKLIYHTFKEPDAYKNIIFHPYQLKQYNDRWYLIGAANDGFILNFALDRIDGYESIPTVVYNEPNEEFEERLEDIVGVTLHQDAEIEKILLWVSDDQFPYIATKPIHGSQRIVKGERDDELRAAYKNLVGGVFVELYCIPNMELYMLLASYLNGVVVLSPSSIADEMTQYIKQMLSNYLAART